MIAVAARATRAIKLPSRKQTRKEIVRIFKEQMKALKERLIVRLVFFRFSPSVSYLV
jgi:hypothetical protein